MSNTIKPEADPSANLVEMPKEPNSATWLIQRMSVSYDGLEDRIALDIANAQGTVARLWLTRYGTDMMVRTTADRVEAYAAAQLAKANVAPNAADQMRQSALATQQLTARLTQRNASAVKLPPGTAEHLVTGITMPVNGRRIQLDFICKPELKARVQFRSTELFQWLAAVQRQYKRAGWAMDVWPSWFSQHSQP